MAYAGQQAPTQAICQGRFQDDGPDVFRAQEPEGIDFIPACEHTVTPAELTRIKLLRDIIRLNQ